MYVTNMNGIQECEHEELEGPPTEDEKVIPYFSKTDPPFRILQKIVLNSTTRFRYICNVHVTGSLQ